MQSPNSLTIDMQVFGLVIGHLLFPSSVVNMNCMQLHCEPGMDAYQLPATKTSLRLGPLPLEC